MPPLCDDSDTRPPLNDHKGIKIAHFNIRSLLPKRDTFKLWLDEYVFDVITVSETWLTSNIPSSYLELHEYDISRLDRGTNSRGGGLLTMARKSEGTIFDADKYPHLNVSDKDAEIQILSLKIGLAKKMIIVNCYRPPSGKIDLFLDNLQSSLDQIPHLAEFEVYVCGDLNIPYNLTTSPGFKKLHSFENKYNLTQVINCPTRCTASTESILDLIFTNSSCIASSGSIEINISDHQPSYIVRKHERSKHPLVNFRCRSFHNYVKLDFQMELADLDWSRFYSEDDVDTLWNIIETNIQTLADKHCPFKEFRERRELKPWITPDLLELLKNRDRLYKLAKRSKDPDDWINARKARNHCNRAVGHARNEFVKAQLDVHSNDPRKFWKALESIWSGEANRQSHINLSDPSTGILLDKAHVPEHFNQHLCNVGRNLSRKFEHNTPFINTLHGVADSFKYSEITLDEVLKLVAHPEGCLFVHLTSTNLYLQQIAIIRYLSYKLEDGQCCSSPQRSE